MRNPISILVSLSLFLTLSISSADAANRPGRMKAADDTGPTECQKAWAEIAGGSTSDHTFILDWGDGTASRGPMRVRRLSRNSRTSARKRLSDRNKKAFKSSSGEVLEEIEVEKEVDRTSVPLVQAYRQRRQFPRVVLKTRDRRGKPAEFHLWNVRIKRISKRGTGASRKETIRIVAQRVECIMR